MHKSIINHVAVGILVIGLAVVGGVTAQAQSDNSNAPAGIRAQIEGLQDQVQTMRNRLRAQENSENATSSDESEEDEDTDNEGPAVDSLPEQASDQAEAALENVVRLRSQMDQGDEGEDVRRLQELLSTDESVYPEGLVTGYFGPLTAQAVARLQGKMDLPQVGRVGPQTLSRVNEILEHGAGNSGNVPEGLLRAPGIQAMLAGEASVESPPLPQAPESQTATGTVEVDVDALPIDEQLKDRLRSVLSWVQSFLAGDSLSSPEDEDDTQEDQEESDDDEDDSDDDSEDDESEDSDDDDDENDSDDEENDEDDDMDEEDDNDMDEDNEDDSEEDEE